MAWSGVRESRLARSWRSPLRPMASPFPAVVEALMTDANLLLFARAAQQFGLVDDGDAEGAGLLQFGPGVRPHHHRRRFLENVVLNRAPGGLEGLERLVRGERGQGAVEENRLAGLGPAAPAALA